MKDENDGFVQTLSEMESMEESRAEFMSGSRGASPPDTLADSLAAMHDENDEIREQIVQKDSEIEELKDQIESLVSKSSAEAEILSNEIKSVKGECVQLREINEKYVAKICDLEDSKGMSKADQEKLQIQLEMINQMNEEIESLRGWSYFIKAEKVFMRNFSYRFTFLVVFIRVR